MGRRSVFSIGVMGLAGPLKGLGVVVAGDGRFEDVLKDLPDCAVVVLGDLAMGIFDPGEISETALMKDWEILVYPVLSPPGVAHRWAAHREFTVVKAVEALPAAIVSARRAPARLNSPPAEWAGEFLRRCTCGKCPSFLRTAQQLGRPTRKNWARRLGLTVRDLWQHLKDCLGVTPREILTRLKQRAFSLGSALARTMGQIAAALGYSGPRSLRRARWTTTIGAATSVGGVDNSNNLSPCSRLTAQLPRTTIRRPLGATTRAPPEREEFDGDATSRTRR